MRYVTHEMALDAGDPSLEGTIYDDGEEDAKWEQAMEEAQEKGEDCWGVGIRKEVSVEELENKYPRKDKKADV